MLIVTFMQIAHASYSYLLAYAPKASSLLNRMYSLRYVYFGVIGAIGLPMGLLTFMAFVSLMQSDQLASYTISKNVLQYSAANVIPFVSLAVLTGYLLQMRRYELENSDVTFNSDYHFGIKSASRNSAKKNQVQKKQLNKGDARQELERLLAGVNAPMPDLEKN